jgi:uncharacterized protein YoxC
MIMHVLFLKGWGFNSMNTLFSAVSLIALMIGSIAIIVAFYKTNLGNATIKHQSDLIQTLTEKVELLTTDLGEVKQKNHELLNRNQYLEGMVTGRQELTTLLGEVSSIRQELSKLEGIMTPMQGQQTA